MFDFQARPMIRLINFHHTPPSGEAQLEAQLTWCAARYETVTPDGLDAFIRTGSLPGGRPGWIPAFYNGYRDNYEIAAPILDRLGIPGWFFVVTDPIGLPSGMHRAFAAEHRFSPPETPRVDGRDFLSAEEIRELSQRHVICSHTASHATAIGPECPEDVARKEIVTSAQVLRDLTGVAPAAFCWLYGEPYDARPGVHDLLREAGYRFLFGSRLIERIAV